jgi:hypothetical protein
MGRHGGSEADSEALPKDRLACGPDVQRPSAPQAACEQTPSSGSATDGDGRGLTPSMRVTRSHGHGYVRVDGWMHGCFDMDGVDGELTAKRELGKAWSAHHDSQPT